MIHKVLALFGFAGRDTQAAIPPLLGYAGLIVAGYFSAVIVERLAALFGWWFSISARTIGVVSALLVGHSIYRAVIHQDDASWGGWIRRILLR